MEENYLNSKMNLFIKSEQHRWSKGWCTHLGCGRSWARVTIRQWLILFVVKLNVHESFLTKLSWSSFYFVHCFYACCSASGFFCFWNICYQRGTSVCLQGRHGLDRMVVGLITTYAISAYSHYRREFESSSGEVYSMQHYAIKFDSDLRQVFCGFSGFLHQ